MWVLTCDGESLGDHHDEPLALNTLHIHIRDTGCSNEHLIADNGVDCDVEGCAVPYIRENGDIIPGTAVFAEDEFEASMAAQAAIISEESLEG